MLLYFFSFETWFVCFLLSLAAQSLAGRRGFFRAPQALQLHSHDMQLKRNMLLSLLRRNVLSAATMNGTPLRRSSWVEPRTPTCLPLPWKWKWVFLLYVGPPMARFAKCVYASACPNRLTHMRSIGPSTRSMGASLFLRTTWKKLLLRLKKCAIFCAMRVSSWGDRIPSTGLWNTKLQISHQQVKKMIMWCNFLFS